MARAQIAYRVETPLVAPLERHMTGKENAGLEDPDLIGKNMNVEDAAPEI